jgi:hypothetical protein
MRAFTRSPMQIAFVLAAMLAACIAALAVGKTILSALALIAKLADMSAAAEIGNVAPRVIPGFLPQSLADRSDNPH